MSLRAYPISIALLGLLTVSACAAGKAGEIRVQSPAWALAGQTTTVRFYGQDLKATGVRFVEPGIQGRLVKVEPFAGKTDEERRHGNTAVEIEVNVPAAAKAGYHAFQLTAEGTDPASGRLLVDTPAPELPEKEPNDTLFRPQVLPGGPVTVLGTLNNEGTDVFQFDGKAGETWRIEIFARRLNPAVKFEPCLRLRDPHRAPVRAAVDEGDDCALEYTLPVSGPYLLEVFDGDNRSGGDFKYRLAFRKL